VPRGASKNNDYLLFDSAEHCAECVRAYEGKKRKR
jgi:hypothetical protein